MVLLLKRNMRKERLQRQLPVTVTNQTWANASLREVTERPEVTLSPARAPGPPDSSSTTSEAAGAGPEPEPAAAPEEPETAANDEAAPDAPLPLALSLAARC